RSCDSACPRSSWSPQWPMSRSLYIRCEGKSDAGVTAEATTMIQGSTLLVAALENEGVDRIYGVPGEENLDVVEAIRKSSIELVLTRHEQAAAFMAATYGRL